MEQALSFLLYVLGGGVIFYAVIAVVAFALVGVYAFRRIPFFRRLLEALAGDDNNAGFVDVIVFVVVAVVFVFFVKGGLP